MILVTFIIGFSKTEGTLIIKCYTFKNIQYWMAKKLVKYIQYFERMYTKKKTDLYLNIFNSPPQQTHTNIPQRKYEVYEGITLSICQWNHVCSISFIWRNIRSSYFTQKLLITCGFVMISTKVILGKLKVTGRKTEKLVFCPYLYLSKTLEYPTSHKNCLWLDNFDSRSFWQFNFI